MSAVLLLGDLPSTGMLGASAAVRLEPPAGAEGEALFIDVVRDALAHRPAVLAVYPAWAPERAERLVTLARGALMTDRVAGLPLRLPPLALSLVADQLAFVAPHVLPGALVSLAPALAEATLAGAWVNSVAHFEHLNVGLGKHVASYLPNGGFSVLMSPDAGVHRVTSAQPVPEMERRPVDPVLLLTVRSSGGDPDWLHRSLSPALSTASLIDAPAQPLSQRYWGAKKYVEFVAISGHPQALQSVLQSALQSAPGVPCAWCGEPIALPRCPFCRSVQPSREDASTPAPPLPRANLSAQPPIPTQPQPQPPEQSRPLAPPQPPAPPQAPAQPHGLSRQQPPAPPIPVPPAQPASAPQWPSGPQILPPGQPWHPDGNAQPYPAVAAQPDPHIGDDADDADDLAPATRPEYRTAEPPLLEADVTRPEYRKPPTPPPPTTPTPPTPQTWTPPTPSSLPQFIDPPGRRPVEPSGPQPLQGVGPQGLPPGHPSGPQPVPPVQPVEPEEPSADGASPEQEPPRRPRATGEIVFPPRDRPIEHDDRSDTVVFGIPRVER